MPYPGPYHGGPWVNEVRDPDGNIIVPSTTPEVAEALDWWDQSLASVWKLAESAGIEWVDTVTAGGTMVIGRGYPVNAAAGPVALTLPTPVPGLQVAVQLTSPTHATNVATVTAGAGHTILGGTRTLKLSGTVEVLQAVSTTLWVVRSTGIPAASLEAWFATDAELAAHLGDTTDVHTIPGITGLRSELDTIAAAAGSVDRWCEVRRTGGQWPFGGQGDVWATTGWNTVLEGGVDGDPYDMVTLSGSAGVSSYVTIPVLGRWRVDWELATISTAASTMISRVALNAANYLNTLAIDVREVTGARGELVLHASREVRLAPGDKLYWGAWGLHTGIQVQNGFPTHLVVRYMGPA